MTREEAISIMNVIVHMLVPQYDTDRIEDAVDMAINALEIEPCEDAISRQAVHDAMYELCGEGSLTDNPWRDNPHIYAITDAIDNLPSVNPKEPKWIPVSERLPKDGQSVLFCDIDNDIMIGYHVNGRPDTHFSQDGTYDDMKNVRAWMPLPKPYEPQESDHKCHTCKHYTSG